MESHHEYKKLELFVWGVHSKALVVYYKCMKWALDSHVKVSKEQFSCLNAILAIENLSQVTIPNPLVVYTFNVFLQKRLHVHPSLL